MTKVIHDDTAYEVVLCESGKCSFKCKNCSIVCKCPTWWQEIHSDETMGLREIVAKETNDDMLFALDDK